MRMHLFLLAVLVAHSARSEPPAYWPIDPLPNAGARVPEVTSTVERELAQLDALADAEAWEEAVDGMLRLAAEATGDLVPVTDDHYLPLAKACQWRMSHWPAAGLQVLRGRIDATASQLLTQAIAERDAQGLQQVVDNYFMSSVGDEALLALADLAMEAGNLPRARGCLLQISPQLLAPDGRPWGVALGSSPLQGEALGQLITASPTQLPENALVYPDSDLPMADVMARLAVISIRERNFARAQHELAVLQAFYPDAQGRFGGRDALLVDAVSSTLAAARDWPTGDTAKLGAIDRVVWQHQLPTEPVRLAKARPSFTIEEFSTAPPAALPALPRMMEPLVDQGTIAFLPTETDDRRAMSTPAWRALNAVTGAPLFGEQGEVSNTQAATGNAAPRGSVVQVEGIAPGIVVRGNVQLQLEVRNGVLVQQQVIRNNVPQAFASQPASLATLADNLLYLVTAPNKLSVLDLAAEGKLQLDIAATENTHFVASPVVHGEAIYLVEQQSEQGGRVFVNCLARTTGRLVWRCPVGALTGEQAAIAPDALIVADDKLMLAAPGLVVAVRRATGQLLWARQYQRGRSTSPNDLSLVNSRTRGAMAMAGGALVCAPYDAAGVFALDAETGQTLWYNPRPWDVEYLLGSVGDRLVATGRQLWILNSTNGTTVSCWPQPLDGSQALCGRGCLAGNEVFCATNDSIRAFNVLTGEMSRNPLPLEQFDATGGGNLTVCGDGLLLSTDRQLIFLGKIPTSRSQNDQPEIQLGTLHPERPQLILQ